MKNISSTTLLVIGLLIFFHVFGSFVPAAAAASSSDTPEAAVAAFEEALKTNDFQKIQEAVRRIQADPAAVRLIKNHAGLNERFEDELFVLSQSPAPPEAAPAVSLPKVEIVESDIPPAPVVKASGPAPADDLGGPIPVNPPGSVKPGGESKPNIDDFMKEARALDPIKEETARQIQEEMAGHRAPTYSTVEGEPAIPPGEDPSWTQIMKASRGETFLKEGPKFSNDPELSELADPRNTYVTPEQVRAKTLSAEPTPAARSRAYQMGLRDAEDKVTAFKDALKAGDPAKIKAANLEIQEDPLAVQQINKEINYVKNRFNQTTDAIKADTIAEVKAQVAQKYHVSPDDVRVVPTQNPSSTPKVGQDWDVTVRVNGKDIRLDASEPIVQEAYYKAAGGKEIAPGMTPKEFAQKHHLEVTRYDSAEAYGSSVQEGEQIINDPTKTVRDPAQLSQAMEHKSNLARNKAADLAEEGKLISAEKWSSEEIRQFTKQYANQIEPRISSQGGKVPDQIKKGVEIMEKVGTVDPVTGKAFSPADAEAELLKMGETPSSIIKKATGLVESSQTLKAPGEITAADDVFVGKVKGQIELDRMEAGRDPVNWEEPLQKPISNDLASGTTRSGQTSLTEGKASFAQDPLPEDTVAFAGKALQYTAQGVFTTAAVSGKIAERGSEKLRSGEDLTAGDAAEVVWEGAHSLPVVAMGAAVGGGVVGTAAEKNRELIMSVEEKEQALETAEKLLARAEDPQEIAEAQKRVEDARRELNEAWVTFDQESYGYYDLNQMPLRILQGKDTYAGDMASNAGSFVVEIVGGLHDAMDEVVRKNMEEMEARAEKEGRNPTMLEGAEFMASSLYDFANELGPRQMAESIYTITSEWAADGAEMGAQDELGHAFDRRFSYHETRLSRAQEELEQLLMQGDSNDPEVQRRKQELLATYKAHYDQMRQIPGLAGAFLNDPARALGQLDAYMNGLHDPKRPEDLAEKLKDPKFNERWFGLIEARKRFEQQQAEGGGLSEANQKRLANLKYEAARMADPTTLQEYADQMLPGGATGSPAADSSGEDDPLGRESDPGVSQIGEEYHEWDAGDGSGGFGEIGEEVATVARTESETSGVDGIWDSETMQAIRDSDEARVRSREGQIGYSSRNLDKLMGSLHAENQAQARQARQDMVNIAVDMVQGLTDVQQERYEREAQAARERELQQFEAKMKMDKDPYGYYREWAEEAKLKEEERLREEARLKELERQRALERQKELENQRDLAQQTASMQQTIDVSEPAMSNSASDYAGAASGFSSGASGRSYDDCLRQYCPECFEAIMLMEESASAPCNTCKSRNAGVIQQCMSGGGNASVSVTGDSSSANQGPKTYYAARRYQPTYKNYNYIIGKREDGGLSDAEILYGPDTYQGCQQWLQSRGFW